MAAATARHIERGGAACLDEPPGAATRLPGKEARHGDTWVHRPAAGAGHRQAIAAGTGAHPGFPGAVGGGDAADPPGGLVRSEEHTSELQSLMRNPYAVFCLKKKKT